MGYPDRAASADAGLLRRFLLHGAGSNYCLSQTLILYRIKCRGLLRKADGRIINVYENMKDMKKERLTKATVWMWLGVSVLVLLLLLWLSIFEYWNS